MSFLSYLASKFKDYEKYKDLDPIDILNKSKEEVVVFDALQWPIPDDFT